MAQYLASAGLQCSEQVELAGIDALIPDVTLIRMGKNTMSHDDFRGQTRTKPDRRSGARATIGTPARMTICGLEQEGNETAMGHFAIVPGRELRCPGQAQGHFQALYRRDGRWYHRRADV